MEVYIDDMLVKLTKVELHVDHLAGIVPGLEGLQDEVKPNQVCFRSLCKEVLGFHSQQPRNRGKSR